MRPDPRIFDDIARVAGGAVSVLSGLREQIRSEIKTRVEELATRLDLVPRDDLDALQSRIDALQADQRKINQRLDLIEGKAGVKKTKTAAPKKPAKAKAKK